MTIDIPRPGPAARAERTALRDYGRLGWFRTLFLTDIWERFSFFGMQAILVLYATAPVAGGGLGLPATTATALYGSYVGLIFVLAVPGGWLGDRVLGEWRATVAGGVIIALGHFTMALPFEASAYAGLALIAAGTGLLKPNLLALLGRFYGPGRAAEREAAISIFYVGIQVSALLAPLVTGFLGETVNWHLGFSAAGVGMTFGVLQFALGARHFAGAGKAPGHPLDAAERRRALRWVVGPVAAVAVLAAVDVLTGRFGLMHVVGALGVVTVVTPVAYFVALRRRPELDAAHRSRLSAYFWLLLASALFWLFVIQGGSTLSLFARSSTDRVVLGHLVPAGWFQSATPLFILVLAPLSARVWLSAGGRLSVAAKFAAGLAFAAGGLLLMSLASWIADGGRPVSPLWLLAAFLLLACGEVAIAPIGLSTSVDVVPPALTGRVIGLYWTFSALGGGMGSMVVRAAGGVPRWAYFLVLGLAGLGAMTGFVVGRARLTRRFRTEPSGPAAASALFE
ncbi:peptide MFS transporter [Sphaerisporangium dianthi]|uniref:Peptide MFS transporter n=1 Tax=Sphaerisporangium dianthi TaxID=1436120 RepID=A0ABV9CJR9_9ACTN